jgi:signal transduction histidine kinase
VHNAFVHAGDDANVEIDLVLAADNTVRFRVCDDGSGFDPSATSDGHGFQNMRDRVGAFGGRIDVVSTAGKGTEVFGRIPLPALPLES